MKSELDKTLESAARCILFKTDTTGVFILAVGENGTSISSYTIGCNDEEQEDMRTIAEKIRFAIETGSPSQMLN